jgi:ethanolamine utilization cobalamin adenosyltransferase
MRKPIITERDVAALPRDQQRLRIDKKSRLTPLAADELRSRGIKVERISS